jgi:WD40 repeat protein
MTAPDNGDRLETEPGSPDTLPPAPRHRRVRRWLILAVALVLVGGGATYGGIALFNRPAKLLPHIDRKIPGGIDMLALSPDGTTLVTDTNHLVGSTVLFWDMKAVVRPIPSGTSLPPAKHISTEEKVLSMAYGPTGTHFYVAEERGSITTWDLNDTSADTARETFPKRSVNAVVPSPDDTKLAAATQDGVFVWSRTNKDAEADPERHGTPCGPAIAFAHGGASLVVDEEVSAQQLNPARLVERDATTGELIGEPFATYPFADGVNSIAVSPNGALVATTSRDRKVRLWDAHTHRQIQVLLTAKDYLNGVSFSAEGSRLVAAGDHDLWVFDTATRKRVADLDMRDNVSTGGVIAPDNRTVIGAAGELLRIWTLPAPAGGAGTRPPASGSPSGPTPAATQPATTKPAATQASATK